MVGVPLPQCQELVKWSNLITYKWCITIHEALMIHIYLDSRSKNSHTLSPEILRALTELFLTVENVAEVGGHIMLLEVKKAVQWHVLMY